jgi:hypothetical protein
VFQQLLDGTEGTVAKEVIQMGGCLICGRGCEQDARNRQRQIVIGLGTA